MQTDIAGLELIKQFEGLRLSSYRDPVGILTIGYGHTNNVNPDDEITEEQAEDYLKEDISVAEITINAAVKTELTQNQFDALVSFVFNLGAGNFVRSTLLKRLNAGDYSGAAKQFDRWIYAGKKELPGLIRRRAAERVLFEHD